MSVLARLRRRLNLRPSDVICAVLRPERCVGHAFLSGPCRCLEPELPGLSGIAGAQVCTCRAFDRPHVEGVAGCVGDDVAEEEE